MHDIRVIAGGVVVCLFASGIFVGAAAAQIATAEPAGQPMQLLQLLRHGKTDAEPHTKLAAKSAPKPSAGSTARTRSALHRKPRSHIVAAEQKPEQLQAPPPAAQAAEPQPALADNAWPAGPTAMTVDATTLAPAPAPHIVLPVAAPAPSELIVDGQTVQVASADEANEIDLAANDASVVANAGSLSTTSAGGTVATDTAGPAAGSEPGAGSESASVASAAQNAEVGSASWFLQVMAALGGAVAAGSAAWFLIGSVPQRTYG